MVNAMIDIHSAAGLRRWAMQCGAAADDSFASGDERERLLTMRRALLELADAQDWLDGRGWQQRPGTTPRPPIKIPA
jgi:hypothetical protein